MRVLFPVLLVLAATLAGCQGSGDDDQSGPSTRPTAAPPTTTGTRTNTAPPPGPTQEPPADPLAATPQLNDCTQLYGGGYVPAENVRSRVPDEFGLPSGIPGTAEIFLAPFVCGGIVWTNASIVQDASLVLLLVNVHHADLQGNGDNFFLLHGWTDSGPSAAFLAALGINLTIVDEVRFALSAPSHEFVVVDDGAEILRQHTPVRHDPSTTSFAFVARIFFLGPALTWWDMASGSDWQLQQVSLPGTLHHQGEPMQSIVGQNPAPWTQREAVASFMTGFGRPDG